MLPQDDIEVCESDPSDPDYGPPESWGLWADRDTIELGPAFTREESLFDEEPASDPLPLEPPDDWPLTGPEDLEDLRHWERLDPFDPLPSDEVDEIPF
jgi:hypothetical protein